MLTFMLEKIFSLCSPRQNSAYWTLSILEQLFLQVLQQLKSVSALCLMVVILNSPHETNSLGNIVRNVLLGFLIILESVSM